MRLIRWWLSKAKSFDGAIERLAALGVLCSKTTYFLYAGFCFKSHLPCYASQYPSSRYLRRMQNTCHPSFQDGLTNILAQTSCHKQIRAFVCDARGCNFEAARQLQRYKLMLTTILRRFINYGSACLRATFRRLRTEYYKTKNQK